MARRGLGHGGGGVCVATRGGERVMREQEGFLSAVTNRGTHLLRRERSAPCSCAVQACAEVRGHPGARPQSKRRRMPLPGTLPKGGISPSWEMP